MLAFLAVVLRLLGWFFGVVFPADAAVSSLLIGFLVDLEAETAAASLFPPGLVLATAPLVVTRGGIFLSNIWWLLRIRTS